MDDPPDFESKPPQGWWKQFWVANHLGGWFRRHLTSLQVVVGHEGKPYTGVYTGFLLERRGRLFWVTAAHCLDDIEQHRSNPALAACWVDNHKDDAARSIPVVDAVSMLDAGLKAPARDVGVLQPSKHEARLFRANGFDVLDLSKAFDDQYLLLMARPGDGSGPIWAGRSRTTFAVISRVRNGLRRR